MEKQTMSITNKKRCKLLTVFILFLVSGDINFHDRCIIPSKNLSDADDSLVGL